jgi:hypothetical protein
MVKHSPTRATAPHVSLIGHITEQELAKYLDHVEVFNGLGNRILWGCVRRSKLLPFGGSCDQSQLAAMGRGLAFAVDDVKTLGEMKLVVLWQEAVGRRIRAFD